jgi:hypothetical protein
MTRTRRALTAAQRCEQQATIATAAGLTDYAHLLRVNAAAWRALPEATSSR